MKQGTHTRSTRQAAAGAKKAGAQKTAAGAKKAGAQKTAAGAKKAGAKKRAPTKATSGKAAGRTASAAKNRKQRTDTQQPATLPVLLSGGNPQIAKGDGDAPVQAYIQAMPGWKRDTGRALDALVVRSVPKVQKAVRWNSPFYGLEGKGWFLSFHCFTKYIKLVFLRGTALSPLPPVGSKHPGTRYFHIHEDDELDEKLLKSWFRQAAKLPGEPIF